MVQIVRREAMHHTGSRGPAWFFHGADSDFGAVSLVINETAAGNGPPLHTHSYDEIFVVVDGQSTFTIQDGGNSTIVELRTGDVARIPAGTPHGWKNTGDRAVRQVDIHLTERMAVATGKAADIFSSAST